MSFLQVFKWFFGQYGIATKEEIIENTASLFDSWAPHEGMEIPIDRFDNVLTFASFARHALSNGTLCTYFLAVIKKAVKYQRAYEDWLARESNMKTWAHLKDFWRQEHLKMKRSNPTAFQYQYSGNVSDNTGEVKNDMQNILENCANQLMNGQQEATTQQQQFQQMMTAQMNALQQQRAMKQGAAAAMQQSAVATMADQRAPTPTTSNRNNNNRGGGWKQQVWNGMETMPAYQPTPGTTFAPMNYNNNNNRTNEKNSFHIFNNQNYCFIHGHHVEGNHTSQTCTMPGPNHTPNASKFNTMGGHNKGAHKTVMPAQYGRVANRNSQRPASQNYFTWRAASFPPRPRNRGNGGGRQQANQVGMLMPMPMMMGQQPMGGMSGEMPGGGQQFNPHLGNGNPGFMGRTMDITWETTWEVDIDS